MRRSLCAMLGAVVVATGFVATAGPASADTPRGAADSTLFVLFDSRDSNDKPEVVAAIGWTDGNGVTHADYVANSASGGG